MKIQKLCAALVSVVISLNVSSSYASPSYIRGADVDKGELEFEYQLLDSQDSERSKDAKRSHKVEAYYGLDDSWQIGAGASFARNLGDDTDLTSLFIEGVYQLIEERDAGYNLAVLGEYVQGIGAATPNKVEAKLLFDTEWGDGFETRANLIGEYEIGENRSRGVEIVTRLGTVYEITDHVKPGLEWHGEYGRTGHDFGDNQEHYLGPVIYGELVEFADDSELEYEIGYFFGLNDNTTDGTLRLLIEYEIEF